MELGCHVLNVTKCILRTLTGVLNGTYHLYIKDLGLTLLL